MNTPRARPRAARFAAALTALLLAACASGGRSPAPAGALAVSGPTLGTQHLVPTACRSGGREDFHGVDLVDERSAIVMRALLDPVEGAVVRLFPAGDPGERGLVLRREQCATLRVEVAPTGSSVNFVDVMRVRVEADCRTRDGDTLRGELAWDECL